MMNKYCITFPFQGEYQFAYLTANQLANAVLPNTDDILDFRFDNEGEDFCYPITVKNKQYEVVFTPDKPQYVNVYYTYDENGEKGGNLVEKEIPWLLVTIEKNKEIVYNLGDNV